jgi:poly(3-hydroxybutyrate) depolymerase
MLYQFHEFQRAMLNSLTAWSEAAAKSFGNPASPLAYVPCSSRLAAAYELLYRLGKDYEKPEFELHQIEKNGYAIPIVEQIVVEKPFCRLIRFKRFSDDSATVDELKTEPIVLVCAPLSGHHATLLRDTVETLLHDTRST